MGDVESGQDQSKSLITVNFTFDGGESIRLDVPVPTELPFYDEPITKETLMATFHEVMSFGAGATIILPTVGSTVCVDLTKVLYAEVMDKEAEAPHND